jgi:hypothetical protein
MTRHLRVWGLCAGALLLGAGCRNQDEDGAIALWDSFQDADYRGWTRAPGFPGVTPSSASHGDAVEIFVNDVVAEALAAGEPLSEWPDGALIVKDGFRNSEPHIVAAMEKRGDEWFWAEYEPDGEVLFSGSPGICTRCHDAGDDYVRAFNLP